MSTFYNISYGSNLHLVRLKKRGLSPRVIGPSNLSGWKLAFHKQSTDSSAKCNAVHTNDSGDVLRVAVYEISLDEKTILDRAEGLNSGYKEKEEKVTVSGREYDGVMYVAEEDYIDDNIKPYDWYKAMVLEGARFHHFPDDYIQKIDAIESKPDDDIKRAHKNWEIVRKMRAKNERHEKT